MTKKFAYLLTLVAIISITTAAYFYNPSPFDHLFGNIRRALNRTGRITQDHNRDKRTSISPESIPASHTGTTLVFDLHGVLLGVDTKKAFNEIGLSKILKYSTSHGVGFSHIEETLTEKVYGILDTIAQTYPDTNLHKSNTSAMPDLVYAWQAGLKTNTELKSLTQKAIEAHPEWFTSTIEKQLVEQIINKMFTPELLIATVKLIPEGLKFIQKCKQQGHTLIILSNWDAESFELLEKQLSELFSLFDAILISGFTHHLKPAPESFASLIERQKKYQEKIIYIDDQEENISAAQNVGLQGIVCPEKTGFLGFGPTPDFATVEKAISHINTTIPTPLASNP